MGVLLDICRVWGFGAFCLQIALQVIGPTVGMLKRRARLLCQGSGLAKLGTPSEYLECWSSKA